MTEPFARALVAQLAKEQGKTVSIHHRELLIKPLAQRTIQMAGGYLIVLNCDAQVTVDSNLGVYDRISENIAECQHKHSGQILLSNYADSLGTVEFLEATFDA